MPMTTAHYPPALLAPGLSWRHRAWILEYINGGFADPVQAALDAGVASAPRQAAQVARRYMERPEVRKALRSVLEDSGVSESAVRAVVHKWMWHEDGNLALRAAELAAKLLGMLREPAPAVPQLPPLIVVQAAPQAVTSGDALPADYTVEASNGRHQNGVDNPSVSDTARVVTATARHAPAHEAHNELPPLINVSEKAPTTPPKARSATKPIQTRASKGKRKKRPSTRKPGPDIPALLKAGRPKKTPNGWQYPATETTPAQR